MYLAVHTPTGEVRFGNAGHCPPLMLSRGDGQGHFAREARSGPLGAEAGTDRPEAVIKLQSNATVLLFTDGLLGA